MAGPWFVDPENGLTTNDGLSVDTPWQLIPGQTGATAQTGYGVVAGDVINVKNGTTTALRVLPPANNLTYRGYGVASNVLELTLPDPKNPARTVTRRVARQWGSHEGMWTIDASANDLSGGAAISTSTRTGTLIEDVDIIGPAVGTRDAVGAASSADNVAGFTMRRFRIRGSTQRGISAYVKNVTIEYGQVHFTADDNIALLCSSANGQRTGSTATLRFLDLKDPNRASEGAAVTGTLGDCIQTVVTAAAGTYLESLLISDICITKDSTGKQAMTLVDANAGITVERFHIRGDGPAQFNHAQLRGTLRICNGHFAGGFGTSDNMAVRFEGITSPAFAYVLDTGALLEIKNITFDVPRFPGLYHCTDGVTAWEFRGTLDISGVTVLPTTNDNAFSFASTVALWSATTGVTFGAGAQINIRNVNCQATGNPHIIMPTGAGNDARFVVKNNAFSDSTYRIGSTSYADLAAFQAAHSSATANIDSDPLMATDGRPMPGSPLIGAGAHITYQRDISGTQRPNPPSIGAYDVATLRPVLTSDPA